MKAGKFIAEVEQAGMIPDKNMKPQPFIQFKTEEGMITWFGSLNSEKSQEIAVKAAITAGFVGNDWDDFSKGKETFDGRKVMITCEEETYEGKTRLKVKWINPISNFESMSASEVKAKVSSAALFAETKSKLGVKAKKEEVGF